jgi:hypothetical protein
MKHVDLYVPLDGCKNVNRFFEIFTKKFFVRKQGVKTLDSYNQSSLLVFGFAVTQAFSVFLIMKTYELGY